MIDLVTSQQTMICDANDLSAKLLTGLT